jgi:hypothetical protein
MSNAMPMTSSREKAMKGELLPTFVFTRVVVVVRRWVMRMLLLLMRMLWLWLLPPLPLPPPALPPLLLNVASCMCTLMPV